MHLGSPVSPSTEPGWGGVRVKSEDASEAMRVASGECLNVSSLVGIAVWRFWDRGTVALASTSGLLEGSLYGGDHFWCWLHSVLSILADVKNPSHTFLAKKARDSLNPGSNGPFCPYDVLLHIYQWERLLNTSTPFQFILHSIFMWFRIPNFNITQFLLLFWFAFAVCVCVWLQGLNPGPCKGRQTLYH